jgi:hypothetical protein
MGADSARDAWHRRHGSSAVALPFGAKETTFPEERSFGGNAKSVTTNPRPSPRRAKLPAKGVFVTGRGDSSGERLTPRFQQNKYRVSIASYQNNYLDH